MQVNSMTEETSSTTFVIQTALLSAKLCKKADNQLSVHGISLTEYLVMRHLDRAPSQAVSRIELAQAIGMSASGITRLVAPMEKIGLLERERNSRDARKSLVKLSKTGRRSYREARASFEHIADGLAGALSQSQLTKLLDLYAKLS
jgi:DNA-binding MarR family transcriptional regulator